MRCRISQVADHNLKATLLFCCFSAANFGAACDSSVASTETQQSSALSNAGGPNDPVDEQGDEETNKEIDRHATLVARGVTDQGWRDSLARLEARPNVVSHLVRGYYKRSASMRPGTVDDGLERWALVRTLGDQSKREAVPHLSKIANDPLPPPGALSSQNFEAETRIRFRALDGLRKHRAIDELRQIYAQKGDFRATAAVLLYDLGEPIPGIRKMSRNEIPIGDPRDFVASKKAAKSNRTKTPSPEGGL